MPLRMTRALVAPISAWLSSSISRRASALATPSLGAPSTSGSSRMASGDDFACGDSMCVRDDFDFSFDRFGGGAFAGVEALQGVVAALDPDVRADGADQFVAAFFIENQAAVDGFERGNHGEALVLRNQRAGWPFQLAHAVVAVYGHDQHDAVAFLHPGGLQEFNVAEVEQVEAA